MTAIFPIWEVLKGIFFGFCFLLAISLFVIVIAAMFGLGHGWASGIVLVIFFALILFFGNRFRKDRKIER